MKKLFYLMVAGFVLNAAPVLAQCTSCAGMAPSFQSVPSSAPMSYNSAPMSYSSAPMSYSSAPMSYSSAPMSYNSAPMSYDTPVYNQGGFNSGSGMAGCGSPVNYSCAPVCGQPICQPRCRQTNYLSSVGCQRSYHQPMMNCASMACGQPVYGYSTPVHGCGFCGGGTVISEGNYASPSVINGGVISAPVEPETTNTVPSEVPNDQSNQSEDGNPPAPEESDASPSASGEET